MFVGWFLVVLVVVGLFFFFFWQAKTSNDLSVDVSGGCMFFLCYYTKHLLKCLRVALGLSDWKTDC